LREIDFEIGYIGRVDDVYAENVNVALVLTCKIASLGSVVSPGLLQLAGCREKGSIYDDDDRSVPSFIEMRGKCD
jgi:hypothetical protein